MSEKDKKDQAAGGQAAQVDKPVETAAKTKPASLKEERLAEALRANLRRRKAAAKARKDD